MAFVVGDRVVFRSLLSGIPQNDSFQAEQPPLLGFVQDTSTDLLDVLWDNGEFTVNLPGDVAVPDPIPVLRTRAPASTALQGQRVKFNTVAGSGNSPEFSGLVSSLLAIEVVPDSDVFVEYALIRTPTGLWYWASLVGISVTP